MTEPLATPTPAAATAAPFSFDLPDTVGGATVTLDISLVPAEHRMALLKSKIEDTFKNRINVAFQRFKKEDAPWQAVDDYNAAVVAYNAANAAHAADPTQPAPEAFTLTPPTAPDSATPRPVFDATAKIAAAVDALYKGETARAKGTPKVRTPKDPVNAAVTQIVQRQLIAAKREAGETKFGLTDAVSLVKGDGIGYLKAKIETAVAAGGDRTQLETYLEETYLKPARILAGVDKTTSKKPMTAISF